MGYCFIRLVIYSFIWLGHSVVQLAFPLPPLSLSLSVCVVLCIQIQFHVSFSSSFHCRCQLPVVLPPAVVLLSCCPAACCCPSQPSGLAISLIFGFSSVFRFFGLSLPSLSPSSSPRLSPSARAFDKALLSGLCKQLGPNDISQCQCFWLSKQSRNYKSRQLLPIEHIDVLDKSNHFSSSFPATLVIFSKLNARVKRLVARAQSINQI